MDLIALGKELEKRRRGLGIPRAEAARRIGVSPNYVWTIERARLRKHGEPSQPSKDVLARWADVLGGDTAYIQRLLILAGHITPEHDRSPDLPLFFATGAPHYPQARAAERDRQSVLQHASELLDLVEGSQRDWNEVVALIRSHLDWLQFRYGRPK